MGNDGLQEAFSLAPQTEALIALLSDPVDRKVLDMAPMLKIVANYAVGVNNLALAELGRRGIVVTNTPGVLTEATADLAFGLLLSACRHLGAGERLVRDGTWQGWSPTLLLGLAVAGSSLGIIGFGRIGQAMARRARGFGMRVVYNQRRQLASEIEKGLDVSYADLDELIRTCDIVSLHCPLTPETTLLMNHERLAAMKPGSVLINTARGACIDEVALAQLLKSGHLFAAGLDVYEKEPKIHPSLLELPNVVLAPHLGSADITTREKMARMSVEGVLAVLAGKEAQNRVR
jgi:glyoxylate reductase